MIVLKLCIFSLALRVLVFYANCFGESAYLHIEMSYDEITKKKIAFLKLSNLEASELSLYKQTLEAWHTDLCIILPAAKSRDGAIRGAKDVFIANAPKLADSMVAFVY